MYVALPNISGFQRFNFLPCLYLCQKHFRSKDNATQPETKNTLGVHRWPAQSVCVTVCNFIVNVWDLTQVSYYSEESLNMSINQCSVNVTEITLLVVCCRPFASKVRFGVILRHFSSPVTVCGILIFSEV